MKLYIRAMSSYRSDTQDLDIKKELKQKYKLDTRRQDAFIHLAVLGAQRLKEKVDIRVDDELYLTSGEGNIDIIQKTDDYVCEQNQFITPFDFINMLGNTTSYYVATSLGVKGKNIFQISDNFSVINSLIAIYASLKRGGHESIFGAIDLVASPAELSRRVLGVDEDCELVSSVNYQKLSLEKDGAIAEIEFDALFYKKDEIQNILKNYNDNVHVSMRSEDIEAKKADKFFQTELSYSINESIKNKKDMIYIDYIDNKYKILRLNNLK